MLKLRPSTNGQPEQQPAWEADDAEDKLAAKLADDGPLPFVKGLLPHKPKQRRSRTMFGYNQDRQHAMEEREAGQLRAEAEAERVERFSEVNLDPPKPSITARRVAIIEQANQACHSHEHQMIGYLAQWVESLEFELKQAKGDRP